ncbi:hypothetical protein B7486_45735 [cyanobacterium TDX16]|nr:hypothetical protein B7486_45735 [cyanobacterium TDX16]
MYEDITDRITTEISTHVGTIGLKAVLELLTLDTLRRSEECERELEGLRPDEVEMQLGAAKQYRIIANALKVLAENTPEDI